MSDSTTNSLECPFCGYPVSGEVVEVDDVGHARIPCIQCGARGPRVKIQQDLAREKVAENALEAFRIAMIAKRHPGGELPQGCYATRGGKGRIVELWHLANGDGRMAWFKRDKSGALLACDAPSDVIGPLWNWADVVADQDQERPTGSPAE